MKHEQVSALLDGELRDQALTGQALAHLRENAEARRCWSDYHLIGEVLRLGSQACVTHARRSSDEVFLSRLRLQVEPVQIQSSAQAMKPLRPAQAANDGAWRLVAGLFVLVAAVGVVGWTGMTTLGLGSAPAMQQAALASVPAKPAFRLDSHFSGGIRLARLAPPSQQAQTPSLMALDAAQQPPVMLRDPVLDRLMAEQQQKRPSAQGRSSVLVHLQR
jgi:sigma-E factor negative regulatory protein RseA